jgi:hypothetical protein
VAWVGLATSARAQTSVAEQRFRDGNRLLADGRLAQACAAFEASNRAEPRAGTLIRLGECRERNQQLASALSAYKDALRRVKDPVKREFATARVDELEARVSSLTVTVPERSRVAGLTILRNGAPLDVLLWNRAVPVDGGDYAIIGRAPGREDWQATVRVAAAGAKITVEVPPLAQRGPAPEAAPRPTVSLASVSPGSATSPSSTAAASATTQPPLDIAKRSVAAFTARRKVAVAAAGAAGVAAVAGAFLGVSSRGKRADAYELCVDGTTPCEQYEQANSLMQAARRRAIEANVAFGVAALAAIGAGVLWFAGAPDEDDGRVRAAVQVSPGAAGVVVLGSF